MQRYVFSLDQGLLTVGRSRLLKFQLFPVLEKLKPVKLMSQQLITVGNRQWADHNGRRYPVIAQDSEYVLHDQSAALLYFLAMLAELLSKKNISPNISFLQEYLPHQIWNWPFIDEEE
jgi:hypothetical protein